MQGFRFARQDSVDTWVKPLRDGDWAVCFLNRARRPRPVAFDWRQQVVRDSVAHVALDARSTTYHLRNLWTGKGAGTTTQVFRATVPSHDVLMLRLRK